MAAGRWSLLYRPSEDEVDRHEATETVARQLLKRYGVVFHRLLQRESNLPPWRDLLRVYRRLEARGEVRGGRFVAGFSGEQYALPEAVQSLRALRRQQRSPVLRQAASTGLSTRQDKAEVTVSGVDPLNLVGILTPGPRVPSHPANRVTYRDGVPVSWEISGQVTEAGTVGSAVAG